MQDIAGVRFEADMTLDEQMAVAVAIAGLFDLKPESEFLHDLRYDHHSGYRAIHVWLQLEGRVEVQVRTQIQGQWANMYERAADVFGREIRYGALPHATADREIVDALQHLSSDLVRECELRRNEISLLELDLAERHDTARTRAFAEYGSNAEGGDRLEMLRETALDLQKRLLLQIAEIENEFIRLRNERRV